MLASMSGTELERSSRERVAADWNGDVAAGRRRGSTRLWDTQPDEMTAAVARLDRVGGRCRSRPTTGYDRSNKARATASCSRSPAPATLSPVRWQLQRAPLAPIRLRIGVHTGEVQLRDEGNYIGPTINRTARLRDLAHGGQTVLSGATEPWSSTGCRMMHG